MPPHNIKDVAKALEILINNPNATFEELYCPIDFPTGGIIINENEVKNSLKNGTGKAALVRAKIEYDSDNHELIVNEMPYMTFTNNAVASISKAIEEGLLLGVESVYDGVAFKISKTQQEINALKEEIVKTKEDVEQVILFGMERPDFEQKKQRSVEIILRLRVLEARLKELKGE